MVGVTAVNTYVAGCAVAESRVRHIMGRRLKRNPVRCPSEVARAVMALEANCEQHGAVQQSGIRDPCGEWQVSQPSKRTAACSNRNGPRRSDVALEAGLLIRQSLIRHPRARSHAPRRGGRAVRVVAVAALHHALVHPVLERHIELRANRSMAFITEVGLRFGEQGFRCPGRVNRMAVGANHAVLRMCRTTNFGSRQSPSHGRKGSCQGPASAPARKMQRSSLSHPARQHAPCPARDNPRSLLFRRFISAGDTFEMRVLVEVQPYVRMARTANIASNISRLHGRGRRLDRRRLPQCELHGKQGECHTDNGLRDPAHKSQKELLDSE